MTLSDLEGRSPTAGPFKWGFSYSCAASCGKFDMISTDSASRGPYELAELVVAEVDRTQRMLPRNNNAIKHAFNA